MTAIETIILMLGFAVPWLALVAITLHYSGSVRRQADTIDTLTNALVAQRFGYSQNYGLPMPAAPPEEDESI